MNWDVAELIIFTLILIGPLPTVYSVEEVTTSMPTIPRVEVEDDVRKAIWCVNGFDEPELKEAPLNEFQPYLARGATNFLVQKETQYNKYKYDYKLRLDELKYTDNNGLFTNIVRNPPNMFSDGKCPDPTVISECKRNVPSKQVPCVKIEPGGSKGCIITMKPSKATLGGGSSQIPTTGIGIGGGVYNLYQAVAAKLHCYMITKCPDIVGQAGEINDDPSTCRLICDRSSPPRGQITNAGHLKFKAFTRRPYPLGVNKVLQETKMEGLVIQMNHSPLGIGKAFGEFIHPEEYASCADCLNRTAIPVGCRKRTRQDIIHPTIMMWHHKMTINPLTIDRFKTHNYYRFDYESEGSPQPLYHRAEIPKLGEFHGPQTEIHANLQWFFPPCTKNKIVEFLVLVVHSFARQDFDLFFLGPYELPSGDSVQGRAGKVPMPFHSGFRDLLVCDGVGETQNILTQTDYYTSVTYPFEYSYSYDVCIRKEKLTSRSGQNCQFPEPSRCRHNVKKDNAEVYKIPRACEKPCEAVTEAPDAGDGGSVFKRTLHGGLNIITNFCLQPICIFIGRYYKETLNKSNWKGQKLWYWIHVLGGAFASVCMYFGYFHPTWIPRLHPHSIAGNALMVSLSVTYVASWIRHKNHYLAITAEFVHWGGGYVCSGLAFWCLETAPNVSNATKVLVYLATTLLCCGYVLMEGCICILDRRFGMRPRRRHFPTIESRFGDLPVPGAVGRIACLILLTVVMFILTFICLFV